MKIMKKVASLVCTFGLLVTSVPISHASGIDNETSKIKIDEVYVTVPYSQDQIEVEYNETDYAVEVIIKDKESEEVLEVFGETKEKKDLKTIIKKDGTKALEYGKTIYKDYKKGPVVARLYNDIDIWSSGSFREITSARKPYWREASSGTWKLERETCDNNFKGPADKIKIWGGANIVITTTKTTTGEFSIKLLEDLGFSVSHATGSTYYARSTINRFKYTYSLY